MKKTYILIFGLLFVTLLTSCDQGASPEALPEAANEKLAYAIATAMDNPDVRESVHSAMDASPYHEHKLILGEFLEHSENEIFKNEVAKKLGGEDILNDILDELPSMDFYLPFETHRETWEHTKEDFYVAVVLDPDTPGEEIMFYHPNGSSETLTSQEQIKQAKISAVFSLHPEEPKVHRDSIRSKGDGYVIFGNQGEDEMQANSTTRVVKIHNYTNDGLVGGDCEFYFMARRLYESHATKSGQVSVRAALPDEDFSSVKKTNLFIYDGPVSGSNKLKVRVKEADGGVNGGDDDYGYFIADGPGEYETSKKEGALGGYPPQEGAPPKAIITLENQ